MAVELVCVDPARIREFWPHFGPLIKRAVDKVGLLDFSLTERDLMSGRDLLWLAYDGKNVLGAAVTSIVGDVCEIVACGGDGLSKFVHLINGLENYARAEKCRATRIIGRKGWGRVLKNYKEKAVIIERPL